MTEKLKPLWIVLDKNGNPWGPFDSTAAAGEFAVGKWGADQWTVVALRHPDE